MTTMITALAAEPGEPGAAEPGEQGVAEPGEQGAAESDGREAATPDAPGSDGRTPIRRAEPTTVERGGPRHIEPTPRLTAALIRCAGRRARLVQQVRAEPDAGMATAEYAIATVAAAGFAGLLLVILRSDEVRGLLLGLIRGALAL